MRREKPLEFNDIPCVISGEDVLSHSKFTNRQKLLILTASFLYVQSILML